MNLEVLELLRCPACNYANSLSWSVFKEGFKDEIIDGVVWCEECRNWCPVEDTLLELLTPALAYHKSRTRFWENYSRRLKDLGLCFDIETDGMNYDLQLKQRNHFDSFAEDEMRNYTSYEQTPFWPAVDTLVISQWRNEISPGKWLLDVGCAQGRSTFKWMDLDLNIVAFDIPKQMIRQAIERYRNGNYRSKAVCFVADASHFPFADESFDYTLLYGVLHHLPDPTSACREIARVLRPGGIYFGGENNRSAFRIAFDLLQKVNPLWHEEAGPEEVFSGQKLEYYFQNTGVEIEWYTSVFLPPRLFYLIPEKAAYRLLSISDRIGHTIPFLNKHGGVIIIRGHKT